MSRKPIDGRKIREVLRLRQSLHLSVREIPASCAIGRTTVGEYLRRSEAARLGWPLPNDTDDEGLKWRLFPPRAGCAAQRDARFELIGHQHLGNGLVELQRIVVGGEPTGPATGFGPATRCLQNTGKRARRGMAKFLRDPLRPAGHCWKYCMKYVKDCVLDAEVIRQP